MDELKVWRGVPIEQLLVSGLTPQAGVWTERIAWLGRSRGEGVYLVGGMVRDLLLGRPHRDLDVTVEGDAGRFADALVAMAGGWALRHPEFGTAVYTGSDGFEVDLVTARSERYPSPACLPQVEPGDLASDLQRRDFAANALALRLAPEPAPILLDPCGGIADLERRHLRVLHAQSFRDDPTRILRGVRLEQRLGFTLESTTVDLARAAIAEGIFSRLSGSRLRHEIALLLEEPGLAAPGLARLDELGVLPALLPEGGPSLRWTSELEAEFRRAEELLAGSWAPALVGCGLRRWRLLWLLLVRSLGDGEEMERAHRRLLFEGADAKVVLGLRGNLERSKRALATRGGSIPLRHVVAEALGGASGEELALLILDPEAGIRAAVELFLSSLRHLQISLRGADLLARGVPSGPKLGEILRAVRRARWDGAIAAEQELDFALVLAQGDGGPQRERELLSGGGCEHGGSAERGGGA